MGFLAAILSTLLGDILSVNSTDETNIDEDVGPDTDQPEMVLDPAIWDHVDPVHDMPSGEEDHMDHDTLDLWEPIPSDADHTSSENLVLPITGFVSGEDKILIEVDKEAETAPDIWIETVVDGVETQSTIHKDGLEIAHVWHAPDSPALTVDDIEIVPSSPEFTDDDDIRSGNSDAERFVGGKGNDSVFGGGGADSLVGWGGDDVLVSDGRGGMLSGNQGDDYLEARKTGYGQYHLYGGEGDDTLVMHLDNAPRWGEQGFHVYGRDGADEFRFLDVENAHAPIVSRINDFDPKQDSLWVDDVKIDLSDLPDDMQIVSYLNQKWLLIEDKILIGLEGAKPMADPGIPTMGGSMEEKHFHEFPTDMSQLVATTWKSDTRE